MATVPVPRTWAALDGLTTPRLNDIRDNLRFLLKPPGAVLAKSGNQSIPHNTITAVTFDVELRDDDAMHSAVNPSRITIVTPGWYWIWANMQWVDVATGVRNAYLYKNGAIVPTHDYPVGLNVVNRLQIEDSCIAGDYFELRALQTSGVAKNVIASEAGPVYTTRFGARMVATL